MRWFFLAYAFERNIRPDAGGFRKLWELAWALKARGHDVLVFYPALPGFSPLRDVPARAYPVVDLPYLRPVTAYLSMVAAAWSLARRDRPDVVYFRSGINILPPFLGRMLKARVVLEVNADAAEFHTLEGSPLWLRRLIMATERLNVRMSNLVVALTPGLKRMLVERYKVPGEKIQVIPSGTDPYHFTPSTAAEAKRKLGFDPDQPIAGFVGFFYRHQGVDKLIEAAPGILAAMPRVRILVVGDGVMRSQWETLAEKLNVRDALHFTGQIPYRQIPTFLQAMDVVVAPFTADRGEMSPFKVLDALAAGRPVVASAVPSILRLAAGFGEAVTVVKPEDPKSLTTAVLTLLSDSARRMRLGIRGREGVLRHYAWEVIGKEIDTAVTTLASDPSQSRPGSRSSALRSRAASVGRAMISWAPVLHAASRPRRPLGVSAIVRVKDEAEWLEPSIRSIRDFADEIIVGDNGSTDGTPEILDTLRGELQDQLVVLRSPELDIRDLTNFLLEKTRFRWVIRWDADFVARTSGPQAIHHLREWLLSLDPRRYFFAYLRMVELCGDLYHQRPDTPSRADCHCFTRSNDLRYVYDKTGYEGPKVPRRFYVVRYQHPTFFHIDVKPVERMFLSFLWKRYLVDPHRTSFPSFEAYLSRELTDHWRGKGIDEAAAMWAVSAFRELVPYDQNRFGDYPALIEPFLDKTKYRLLYEDGQIVGQQRLETSEGSVLVTKA